MVVETIFYFCIIAFLITFSSLIVRFFYITFSSIIQFSELDELKINEGIEVSENIIYYFYIELILSLLFILFSYLIYFKIALIISVSITIYNIFTFLKGSYKLDFRIGEVLHNKKIYDKESFKYKIKFAIYVILFVLSFIKILLNILQFVFDALFHDLDNY